MSKNISDNFAIWVCFGSIILKKLDHYNHNLVDRSHFLVFKGIYNGGFPNIKRSTPLSYISNALYRDTPLGHVYCTQPNSQIAKLGKGS